MLTCFGSVKGRMALGNLGERLARDAFATSYEALLHPDKRGDLRLRDRDGQVWYIEVKTARPAKDGQWRFRVRCKGHCDHRKSDFVLLLAVFASRCEAFLLPVSAVATVQTITLASHPLRYSGKYSLFRQSLQSLSIEQALHAGATYERVH